MKVSVNNQSVIIKPEQQALFNYESAGLKVVAPNMEEVLAWKEGRFQFEEATIESIMRQIQRWYDVKVIYSGKIPAAQFNGILLRKSRR